MERMPLVYHSILKRVRVIHNLSALLPCSSVSCKAQRSLSCPSASQLPLSGRFLRALAGLRAQTLCTSLTRAFWFLLLSFPRLSSL